MSKWTETRDSIWKHAKENPEYYIVAAACLASWCLGVINGARWF